MTRQPTPDLLGEAIPSDDPSLEAMLGSAQRIATLKIRLDGGTQPRAGIDQAMVDDYANDMANGAVFPPVELVYDGTEYWLWDGFHRFHAYRRDGDRAIPANVRQGTRRDAVLLSVGANATHGLRRTNADKRRSVLALLEDAEWSSWSNQEIARRCAVSAMFVGNMRSEIAPINGLEVTERRGADGKLYHVENIGKRPAEPPPDREVPDNVTVGVWKCLCEARWELGRIKCPRCGVEHLSWDLPPWLRDAGWRLYRLAGSQYRADHDILGSIVMMDIVRLRMEMKRRSDTGASTTTWLTADEIVVLLDQWSDQFDDPDRALTRLHDEASAGAGNTIDDWSNWVTGNWRLSRLLQALAALRLRPDDEDREPEGKLGEPPNTARFATEEEISPLVPRTKERESYYRRERQYLVRDAAETLTVYATEHRYTGVLRWVAYHVSTAEFDDLIGMTERELWRAISEVLIGALVAREPRTTITDLRQLIDERFEDVRLTPPMWPKEEMSL